MGGGRREAKLFHDGGDEETSCVAGVDDTCRGALAGNYRVRALIMRTKVCRSPQVDLGVRKDSLCSSLVQSVHYCVASVVAQSSKEESAFFVVQETRRLWPVHEPELGKQTEENSDDALDDEDPAPAAITSDTIHFGDGEGE